VDLEIAFFVIKIDAQQSKAKCLARVCPEEMQTARRKAHSLLVCEQKEARGIDGRDLVALNDLWYRRGRSIGTIIRRVCLLID
jgi:hypothetical protein